jgi:phosphatidylserine decarboxylase
MRLPVPRPFRRPLLGALAWALRMDLTEAADPVEAYRSASELFTRELKPGVRSWPTEAGVAGSPVDGIVGQSGRIEAGRVLQAKGREYTVAELLDDERMAARFVGGSYLTIYLSPRHYHRIHAPVAGRVSRARHVPGRLLPVNTPAVRGVDRLFPRNERLITYVEPAPGAKASGAPGAGAPGAVAVVAVGAFNVGRITAAYDATLVTNRRGARAETRLYDPPVALDRGAELMTFHLGSTVVLLFEDDVALEPRVPGSPILLGAPLTS